MEIEPTFRPDKPDIWIKDGNFDADEYLNQILSIVDTNMPISYNVARILQYKHNINSACYGECLDSKYFGLHYDETLDSLNVYTSQKFEREIKVALTKPVAALNVCKSHTKIDVDPPDQYRFANLWCAVLFETYLMKRKKTLSVPLKAILPQIIVEKTLKRKTFTLK